MLRVSYCDWFLSVSVHTCLNKLISNYLPKNQWNLTGRFLCVTLYKTRTQRWDLTVSTTKWLTSYFVLELPSKIQWHLTGCLLTSMALYKTEPLLRLTYSNKIGYMLLYIYKIYFCCCLLLNIILELIWPKWKSAISPLSVSKEVKVSCSREQWEPLMGSNLTSGQ